MNTNNGRDGQGEDGGYGASNLVGSNESGLQSAREGRQASRESRDRGVDAASDGVGGGARGRSGATPHVDDVSADAPDAGG